MIRLAAPGDVPQLLDLIHELAAFEREPNAVVNDVHELHAVLFGPHPSVYAHVVDENGRLVACAIWFVNYSTWTGRLGIYLEDLIVRESARGNGYGRALVAELARICVERGYSRLEWAVLDWNEAARRFYEALGGRALESWVPYRLSGDALTSLAVGASG